MTENMITPPPAAGWWLLKRYIYPKANMNHSARSTSSGRIVALTPSRCPASGLAKIPQQSADLLRRPLIGDVATWAVVALWRLLYETAARANELLALDVEDLDLANRRARVHSKGGAVEWVFWQAGSAQLLPCLLVGRTGGPVFLGGRRPTRAVADLDLDPASGRARLSYRRAAELFHARTGWTLHQLRRSALTHAAEDGTNLPPLLARSRHASVRSLERYARPGPEAVARHLAETDPGRRRP